MIRSILSILAGVATWTALFLGGNQLLFILFADRYGENQTTQDPLVLLCTLLLSIVASIAAGWVTARVARRRPIPHTVALGLVQLAIGIPVQLSYWDAIPLWYHLAFLALLLPGNVLGGMLSRGR